MNVELIVTWIRICEKDKDDENTEAEADNK